MQPETSLNWDALLKESVPVDALGEAMQAHRLSSECEGRRMVILKALALGLPVIATGLDSIRDALPEGFGAVVGRDPAELATATESLFEDEQPSVRTLDVPTYNDGVLAELRMALRVTVDRAQADR